MNALDLPYEGKETPELVKKIEEMWLIVGPVRVAQHLSNVWHASDPQTRLDILSQHDQFHPLSKWAGASFAHYSWLYFYGMDLCDEYESRFKMVPSIKIMLARLETAPESLPETEWTEPPHA